MKFTELVYNLVVEGKKEEAYQRLLLRWSQENDKFGNLEPEKKDELAKKILTKYSNIKQAITPTSPAIIAFQLRHDGKFNTKQYSINDLKMIEKIHFDDLIDLLNEFGDFSIDGLDSNDEENLKAEKERIKKIFETDGNESNNQKVQESKKMWFSTTNAVVNDDGFRVYRILNQEQSIKMGYYYQMIHRSFYLKNSDIMNQPWCVTWRYNAKTYDRIDENGKQFGELLYSQSNNMYGTYRHNYGLTFYFIIDESKSVESTDGKYYMSALQIGRDGRYILTSLFNDGDKQMSWNDIVEIYPKLSEYKGKIVSREMDEDEIQIKSILDIVNENENDANAFWRQTPQRKKQFIEAGGQIRETKSWDSMTKEVKKIYISSITSQNALFKISTERLLQRIVTTEGFANTLNKRLTDVGLEGLQGFTSKLMGNTYGIHRTSEKNQNIIIYRNNVRKDMFGIFDLRITTWLTLNDTTYFCDYKLLPIKIIYMDNDGNQYIPEIFSRNGDENSIENFYSLSSDLKNASIFSGKRWNELIQNGIIYKIEDEDYGMIDKSKEDLDKEIDINEKES